MNVIVALIILCFFIVGWRMMNLERRIDVLESRPQPFHLHDKEMHADD